MTRTSPLLSHAKPDAAIAYWNDSIITRDRYLRDVAYVAQQLPTGQFVLNMCQDRYLFLVAFASVLVAGKTNLLPPNRCDSVVRDIMNDYAGSYYLCDDNLSDDSFDSVSNSSSVVSNVKSSVIKKLDNPLTRYHQIRLPSQNDAGQISIPQIASDFLAAITFTSGSTGRPQPNEKYWGALVTGVEMARARFYSNSDDVVSIIATVPPQHMYGLETSVMMTLLTGSAVYSGATFFPEDIREAIEKMPAPRILITTPIHLKTCNQILTDMPEIKTIISATAPLATHVAAEAEEKFKSPVMEIFGCTETGSIASRHTLEGDLWLLYDGFKISQQDRVAYISGAYLAGLVPLADRVEIKADNRFKIIGRSTDMVNIAGKRGSIADLNQKLLEIEGIEDGVFYLPEAQVGTGNNAMNTRMERLVAFVVAPELDEKSIMTSLSTLMDPVFLPRPLYKVNSLPRTQSSKLSRSCLTELYTALGKENSSDKKGAIKKVRGQGSV